MSYTSGFFDAVDLGGGEYDREYSAAVFAHYFSLLVKNGVFPDPSTGMQVKASTSPDMHVSVQPGSGWVNGYYITVPENGPEVLTVPTANPSLSRIDSVIMGLNYVEREIQLYIKSGAVSASPSAVSLQRDNDLYEMELAQVTVAAGVASISQASITDMRQNASRCGIVKGTIDQIDTTDLFAQYDDAFQTWFADIQAQLSGDVATNLQNQINQLKESKVNTSDKATTAEAQTGTATNKWMTPSLTTSHFNSRKATTAEAQTGTNDAKFMTPAKVDAYVDKNVTVVSIGALWREVGRFTATGAFTFTVPAGIVRIRAVIVGGGGGGSSGAKGTNVGFGGPGGGGGFVTIVPSIIVTPGQKLSGVVGTGGAGGVGGTDTKIIAGTAGGTSSFAGFTALGGEGGNSSNDNTARVDGGAGGAKGGDNGGNYSSHTRIPTAGESDGVYIEDLGLFISAGGGAGGGYDYTNEATSLTDYSTGKPGGTCFGGQFAGGRGGNAAYKNHAATVGSVGGSTCGGGGGGGGNNGVGYSNGNSGGAGGPGMVILFAWGLKE